MSAKGCSPDNAAAEGFFGRLKQEFFHERDFTGVTMDEFIRRLDEYMVWYRDERIKLEYRHQHHPPEDTSSGSWHNRRTRTTGVQQNVTTPYSAVFWNVSQSRCVRVRAGRACRGGEWGRAASFAVAFVGFLVTRGAIL